MSPAPQDLDENAGRRGCRTPTIRTTAPDWLFSAVIHLLLIALLLTSKAGPGGGGGGNGAAGAGSGAGGSGDFPGDGWIEAQIGAESSWGGPTSVPIVTVPAPPSDPSYDVPVETVQQTVITDADAVANESPVQQTSFTPPALPKSIDATAFESSPSANRPHGDPTGHTGPRAGGTGPGAGLGHGRGDGSPGEGGGGKGGTSLFGIWDSGERIVYAIDRSSSMQHYEKLVAARQELEASLGQLDASSEFQVLYYNQQVQPLSLGVSRGLIRASAINKSRVRGQIRLITAEGGTDHRTALQAALEFRPTVVYFLTDAEDNGLTTAEITAISRSLRGRTRIHCIQFGDVPGERPTAGNWLEQLADATGGQYVHFRTESFQRVERPPSPFR